MVKEKEGILFANVNNTKLVAHKCGYLESDTDPNSLEALQSALGKTYIDGIEFDIRITADNEIVVIHDGMVNLSKDPNKKDNRWVSQLTLKQLKELKLGQHGSTIMTLDDFLSAVNTDQQLVIEIKRPYFKAGELVNKYYEIIKHHKEKNIITMSFFYDVLENLKDKDHNLETGLFADWKQLYNLLFINQVNTISLDQMVLTQHRAKDILDKGKNLSIWTIKDPEQLQKAIGILGSELIDQYGKKISFTTGNPDVLANERDNIAQGLSKR